MAPELDQISHATSLVNREQSFTGFLWHPHTSLILSFSLRLMSISARRLANSGKRVRTLVRIDWPSNRMTIQN